MDDEEYNRLYLTITARLSAEEHLFWAKTAALNIQGAETRLKQTIEAHKLELRRDYFRGMFVGYCVGAAIGLLVWWI